MLENKFSAGQTVVIRDEEWLIKQVRQQDSGSTLICDGVSELIRGVEGKFHTLIEPSIEALDPRKTKLVVDVSPRFTDSRLFIESHLRRTVVNDDKIRVGHHGAMTKESYQLEPAFQSLKQVRQRILIADSVGLGKTLEAGILVSELIARGRGRRILVVVVKSMLVQFQKEFWTRFAIPLTRLDSLAIQRIQADIPANHNPFLYLDKSIISIDTLKGNDRYRRFLELAHWDIIVIDEAHNVAKRGTKQSQRSRLAEILAGRSDTLIMLSATPHDGRANSFASLMNMLDPTAIADPQDYVKDDYSNKGLVVRRFKKDLRVRAGQSMQEAEYYAVYCESSQSEEQAYRKVSDLREIHNTLQSIGVEKALLSSPAACLQSVRERQKRIANSNSKDVAGTRATELKILQQLELLLKKIDTANFSKYQLFLEKLQDSTSPLHWKPKADDRLVIFTERIATLEWLSENLTQDLQLRENQVEVAHGALSDVVLQQIVDDFGNLSKPVRILICSDVASEGINLHFLCHRLIHFDLPWSLMTYSQRNGRIDRYGQQSKPQIVQLVNQTKNELIAGDINILDLLRKKSEEAEKNIGDPALVMGKHNPDAEVEVIKEIILRGGREQEFEAQTKSKKTDGETLLEMFLKKSVPGETEDALSEVESLYQSDFDYCVEALRRIRNDVKGLKFEVSTIGNKTLELIAPDELKYRYRRLPTEVQPDMETNSLILTSEVELMSRAIEFGRTGEDAWPREQYLWRLSPVLDWLNDRMRVLFHRNEAPLLALSNILEENQDLFVISGLCTNQRSHPLFYDLVGVEYRNGEFRRTESVQEFDVWKRIGSEPLVNRGSNVSFLTAVESKIPDAVAHAERFLKVQLKQQIESQEKILDRHTEELLNLEDRQKKRVEAAFNTSNQPEQLKVHKRDEELRNIKLVFDRFADWVTDSLTLVDEPVIAIVAVLTGRVP